MNLKIYPLLSIKSKKAMLRTKKAWGHPYRYTPRRQLINRLKRELSLSEDAILKQITQERAWLL